MPGETDLDILLRTLNPQLDADSFVFLTFANKAYGDHEALQPIGAFSEHEGLTLVVEKSQADHNAHPYSAVFRKITLTIHSSLEAVGLTAAVSTRLAQYGISANIISGYYHDHVFVPEQCANLALSVLQDFTQHPALNNPAPDV